MTGSFFDQALAAAPLCGVTRLADITGLDRLGLPVWQAVRPAGLALSVHQGKGESPLAAKIGALCEAIESHCAEHAPQDGPLCAFAKLPASQRSPDLADYCRVRESLPEVSAAIQWCEARDLATGATQFLPHPVVSLDYRSGLPSKFERTSGGLGAGPGELEAVQAALLEVVERDAVGEWQRLSDAKRRATCLALDTVAFDWFRDWRDRLARCEVDLTVFAFESVVGTPVFMCVIGAVEEFGTAYREFSGTATHGDPEVALFKALAEAIQSRLTLIAGVRDDILPGYYKRRAEARRPRNGYRRGRRRWAEAEPIADLVGTIADRLAQLGYRTIVVKRLDEGLEGVAVAKVFVPGLGSLTRTRRAAQ
jgi:ribosomal protein S12 methylthiotransferase accessory factor